MADTCLALCTCDACRADGLRLSARDLCSEVQLAVLFGHRVESLRAIVDNAALAQAAAAEAERRAATTERREN